MTTTSDLYDEMQELNDRQQDEDQADPLDEADVERLAALVELFDTIDPAADLIAESDFERYAQDYAESISELGDVSMYVDWSRYAADLAINYRTVEFAGDSYYYRAS